MSSPPLLLLGQGQPEESVSDLSPAPSGLPGSVPLDSTPLQLPVSAEEGQLCAGTLVALFEYLLALQPGAASVQHRGLVEELISEGHLQ